MKRLSIIREGYVRFADSGKNEIERNGLMLSKEEELKRSRLWRIVITVSSVLVVVIASFFLVKMFRANPLEGTWRNEDSDMVVSIKGSNSLTVSIPEALEGEGIKMKLDYSIDKDEKTISIKMDESAKEKAVKDSDGQITGEMLESAASSLLTTFDYSIDQEELTLTEREYGEQMLFVKE